MSAPAVRWAREHGCDWDEGTCAVAAQNGHLEILKYAREHCCPWIEDVMAYAARGGNMEAGVYTRPLFELNISTFSGIRWLASVCQ